MNKLKINKKIKVIAIIIGIIIIINLIYNIGRMRGVIDAVGFTSNKLNSSTCEIINRTRDDNGYCILKTGAKYEVKLSCPFENYIVKGEEEMNDWLYALFIPQKVFYYPFIGCW